MIFFQKFETVDFLKNVFSFSSRDSGKFYIFGPIVPVVQWIELMIPVH
jgi:hypothetical protein